MKTNGSWKNTEGIFWETWEGRSRVYRSAVTAEFSPSPLSSPPCPPPTIFITAGRKRGREEVGREGERTQLIPVLVCISNILP